MNPYVYVGGNPVMAVDPLGLYGLIEFGGDVLSFTAGLGNAITFGGTTWGVTQFLDKEDSDTLDRVKRCDSAFKYGEWTSLVLGGGRIAYAGVAKSSSYYYASRDLTMRNAEAASAFRNGMKKVFRLNPFSKFRVYPFSKMIEKYGSAKLII